jgi:hypothetical protein
VAFVSYTHCVDRHDYEIPDFSLEAAMATLGAFLGNPAFGTWAAINLIEELLDYMLNKKLVCLDGDRCAVGRIVGFETVDDKSFPEDVDNDFSINLMLFPSSLGDFVGKDGGTGWEEAKGEVQGDLITEQPDMPEPRTPDDSKHYSKYSTTLDIVDAYAIGGFNTMVKLEQPIQVPVLHAECEGSRIHDLLQTLQDIESFGLGKDFCEIPVIGWIACALAKIFLSPIILAGLIAAWFAADDGNPDDARVDPEAGELALGDLIVVTGRWVFDAGHAGYNEFHPVKSIQKAGGKADYPLGDPAEYIKRWCKPTSEVPPPDRDGPGGAPQGMTPGQQGTWDAQREPHNRWVIHPFVDGCAPKDEDEQPPLIK